MRRIRIQRLVRRDPDERHEILPLDPRDPDVVRAKAVERSRAEADRGWRRA